MDFSIVGLFIIITSGIIIGWLLLPMAAGVLITLALVAVGGWVLDRLRRPEPK